MSINFKDALKAKKLRDFFHEHGRIYILLDATADDVQLPESLKHEHALPLVLNARMPQPIHIRDTFLESNFSFSGVSEHCVIPMNRIWAAYLPESDFSSGLVWQDDMPEIVKVVMQEADKMAEKHQQKTHDDNVALQTNAPKEDEIQAVRKVKHLRVIK